MNQIRTALLSYGMSGEVFHAPLLSAHDAFQLSIVVQRNSQRAKEHYSDVVIMKRVEDALNDRDIELVIVNTPNETHYGFAEKALEAGKHVIVEKPFTVTAKEAEDLIALARKKNKVLTVFQSRRWDGDFLTVKKVLESGVLGKVVSFEAHYDRFRNYVEANTWKEESGRGTGILYNLGSHMLDQAVVLFGLPQSIDARLGIQRPGGRVDDYYDIRMQYKDLQVIVKSSYLVREQGPRYTIHGVNGSFVKYGIDPQEQALKEKKDPKSSGWGIESEAWWGKLHTNIGELEYKGLIGTVPGNYSAFYDNVFAAIREGKDLAVKPEESLQVIRLIEACLQSSRERRAINLL